MAPAAREALVIGVGNPRRGDDAAGLLAARELRGLAPAGVVVLERSGEAAGLLRSWEGAARVFCVDAAVVAGVPPGQVERIDAAAGPLPTRSRTSTHGFGLAEAVELGRALGALPPDLVLYGIVGVRFGLGLAPTLPVREAAREVAGRIFDELRSRARGEHGLEEAFREQGFDPRAGDTGDLPRP